MAGRGGRGSRHVAAGALRTAGAGERSDAEGPQARTRGPAFNHDEEKALADALRKAGMDDVVGANQKNAKYIERFFDSFSKNYSCPDVSDMDTDEHRGR